MYAGRLPGAVKYRPGEGLSPFWKIPIKSIVMLNASRKEQT
jgi:hypothetical protein